MVFSKKSFNKSSYYLETSQLICDINLTSIDYMLYDTGFYYEFGKINADVWEVKTSVKFFVFGSENVVVDGSSNLCMTFGNEDIMLAGGFSC